MKSAFCQRILFVFFLLASPNLHGQTEPFISQFNASKSGQQVLLSWIMNIGSTCNGIIIFRSTDSVSFQQIGVIPGICGSTVETVRYTYADLSPVPDSRNYYLLEFGGAGISDTISIDIIQLGTQGYEVWPNPIRSEAKIFFANDQGFIHQLKLFSLNGIEVLETTTDRDYFLIQPTFLPGGLYTFTISLPENSPLMTGKIILQP